MAAVTLVPPPKPSTWALLFASRKVRIGLVIGVLVSIILGVAELGFFVLLVQARITGEAFVIATCVTIPSAVLGLVPLAWKVIDGITREDVASKSVPTVPTNVQAGGGVTVQRVDSSSP